MKLSDFEEPWDAGEIAHWAAAPMKDVGTFDQFHEVVNRVEQILREMNARPELRLSVD